MGKQLRRILDGYHLLNEPVQMELFLAIAPLRAYIQPDTSQVSQPRV
jgi:hypothetical protein